MAFGNVERTLATAGAIWSDVFHVNSYHVPVEGDAGLESHVEPMVELLRRYFPDQPPIWTCVGVPALGDPKMRVEIRVTAQITE